MICPKCHKELNFNDHISMAKGEDESIHILLDCHLDFNGCGYEGFWVIGVDDIVDSH